MIKPSHYYARPLSSGSGYTWTLASRLGDMLEGIESLYGPRDMSWTFVGLEFEKNGPQCWFPGNCKNIAIQLGSNALSDQVIACYQLAHEAVHLLAPDGDSGAPVIEEGVATVYSEDFVEREFNRTGMTNKESYVSAANCVRELLAHDASAILKLRSVEPSFKKMTADTFAASKIDFCEEKITALLASFVRE